MMFLARRLSFLGLALLLLGGCFFTPKASTPGGGGSHDGGGGDDTHPWEKYPSANTDLFKLNIHVNADSVSFASAFATTPNAFSSDDTNWKHGKMTITYSDCFLGLRDDSNTDSATNRNLKFTFHGYPNIDSSTPVIAHFYLNDKYLDDSKVQLKSSENTDWSLPSATSSSYADMSALTTTDTFYFIFEIKDKNGQLAKSQTPVFSISPLPAECNAYSLKQPS